MNKRTLLSLSILILLGFIWGSGYTLAKYAMTHDVPALGYAFWQSAGPALLLTLLCLLTGNTAIFQWKYWSYFLICGLVGITIPNTNMYFIASHIPAGLLAVLVNTVPLLVYPMALLVKQEYFDSWRMMALVIGVSGILLIIGPTFYGLLSGWALLALLSPFAFALCSIYIAAKQPSPMTALEAATGMLLASTLLLFPLIVQQQSFYSLAGSFTLVKQVILLEIILSSLGYLLFFSLLRLAGPVFYSLTGGMVALTGLFWGFVVFHEIPNHLQILAIFLVMTALFLLSWRQSKQVQEAM
ncbi:DMT family transporter [Legionella jamestowniensis]|uniref:ABC transporter permease n=1 Tax=Legionella jamestowniensis TaxID=455 RepID=A0A0W0UL64_9GAMM|nr:DMT family transporter [Legionella jamestowniensis]KTD08618.1 ABC transporter permease [Legionella jamestowniensis]SFL53669.1 EamA-like transporter family protein [Legionella jamestowniensis DSM 19215]